jgi:hypothetical protein
MGLHATILSIHYLHDGYFNVNKFNFRVHFAVLCVGLFYIAK